MALEEYRKKRRFNVTPEPAGKKEPARKTQRLLYVIQKHRATALHYDFRLEWNGVLLSWAVPKGPSLDPSVKRLATHVEDHPIEYATFEGIIPAGEYGGGTVMVWDNGTWEPESPDVDAALEKGELKFALHGKKLEGSWVLVRTRGWGRGSTSGSSSGGSSGSSRTSWLLIKHRDESASTEEIAETQPRSIVTKRLLTEIAIDEGGDAEKAATGDPAGEIEKLLKNPKLLERKQNKKPAVWHSNRTAAENVGESGKENAKEKKKEKEKEKSSAGKRKKEKQGEKEKGKEKGKDPLPGSAEASEGSEENPSLKVKRTASSPKRGRSSTRVSAGASESESPSSPSKKTPGRTSAPTRRRSSTRASAGESESPSSLSKKAPGRTSAPTRRRSSTRASGAASDSPSSPSKQSSSSSSSSSSAKSSSSSSPSPSPRSFPVPVSNPDKVFWPDEGYTKGDLVAFYQAVFPKLKPYVDDRLLSLERSPDGLLGQAFYQKEKPAGMPPDTPTKRIEHDRGATNYVVGGKLETQLALANLACIPIHVWGSCAKHTREPDWVCFDLDPDSGLITDAVKAAWKVKEALDALGLVSFVKTSGGKGLHIFVPIRLGPSTDEVLWFAQELGTRLAAAYPKELTMEMRIAARKGRVLLDSFRNGYSQTVASPYSVRKRPAAPVSTPLEWSEVTPALRATDFTLGNFADRMKKADPWAAFFKSRQSLKPALAALKRL